jgi:hypothetical protein
MMTRFFRRPKTERERSKMESRIAALDSHELIPWAEQGLYTIGKSLTDWSRNSTPESLEEAQLAAEAVLGIVQELLRRAVSRPE